MKYVLFLRGCDGSQSVELRLTDPDPELVREVRSGRGSRVRITWWMTGRPRSDAPAEVEMHGAQYIRRDLYEQGICRQAEKARKRRGARGAGGRMSATTLRAKGEERMFWSQSGFSGGRHLSLLQLR